MNVPILRDGRIYGLERWTLEHVLSAISESAPGIVCERERIEVLTQPTRLTALADGEFLAGYDIRTIFELLGS